MPSPPASSDRPMLGTTGRGGRLCCSVAVLAPLSRCPADLGRAYRKEFAVTGGPTMTDDRHTRPTPPRTGGGLRAVARERAVMSTVADVIVAAATGRGLRVAVGCADPGRTVFADQLTRALVARGRACRCVTASQPRTVSVITSGAAGLSETDLCRIDIQVDTSTSEAVSEDGGQPDIVIDYRHPDGPTIRYIVPALPVPAGRR
jgi:hypothetical protein